MNDYSNIRFNYAVEEVRHLVGIIELVEIRKQKFVILPSCHFYEGYKLLTEVQFAAELRNPLTIRQLVT